MKKVIIPENLTGKELFDFLIENKNLLIAQKKSILKEADGFPNLFINEKGEIAKASLLSEDIKSLDATLIINTTNYFDSHKDVHIPGIWKKSLSETKEMYLCNSHFLTFEDIITDEIKAYTKTFTWKELGYNKPGTTEALVFDAKIENERNPFMFNQYRKGYVKNHSVGMRYVKILLAINDEDYKEEFAVWNQYIDEIVNKEDAEDSGFFWAVKEAKVIEGSAVVRGSNRITPVYRIQSSKQDSTEEDQPPKGTGKNQPPETREDSHKVELINWDKVGEFLLKN